VTAAIVLAVLIGLIVVVIRADRRELSRREQNRRYRRPWGRQ